MFGLFVENGPLEVDKDGKGTLGPPSERYTQHAPSPSDICFLIPIYACNVQLFTSLVHQRNVTWNKDYHMLYIDNPVGTGFSFTSSSHGLSNDENEVANNLYR